MNNDPPIRSTIAKVVAFSLGSAILHSMMNRILFNQARPHRSSTHGEVLIVPFVCEDAMGMDLYEPTHNRSERENDMARSIVVRLIKALADRGYIMVNFSFSSMTVTVKPTNPVK
jgi:hypothetical protein